MREQSEDQEMETEVLVLADDYANDVFNKTSGKMAMIKL